MSVQVAMDKLAKIEGWLTESEGAALYSLARNAKHPIVEIGSWRGRSTTALALGSMDGQSVAVYAVDSFVGVDGSGIPCSPEVLRKNLDQSGINGLVKIIAASSEEAAPNLPNDVGLLFIDGGHEYETIMRDFELHLPRVVHGGKVAIHDVCDNEPGVVRAVDEVLLNSPSEWRLRTKVDGLAVFERRKDTARRQVVVGFPGSSLCYGTAKGLLQASMGCHDVEHKQSGLGWDDMNRLWVDAINGAKRGELTHFAMLHSDIMPSPGWVDLLLDEMEDTGADFISAVAAIKDDNGLTSCGVGDASEPWAPFRRFTMRELFNMPETFSIKDTQHPSRFLLHNSGCFIADMRSSVFRKVDQDGYLKATFAFPIAARVTVSGDFVHLRESEDWHFSRKLAEIGARTFVTRRVRTVHFGQKGFPNDFPWGKMKSDEATADRWRAECQT